MEYILFVVFAALVLVNNGVQAYIHFEAYPLFKYVGKGEFATYLTQYEQRLTVPLLAPYGLTVLSNLALLAVRPDDVSIISIIIVLLLNIGVAVVSVFMATPIYNRIKAAGEAGSDLDELMKINLIRLGVSTLISLIVCAILVGLLK